jgi:hypothetical protein
MQDLPVYLAMTGFLLMGVGALLKPVLVTGQFGVRELSAAGRNEIRAVYGGFGVTMAAVLTLSLLDPELRPGILISVALALGGMAVGRLISAAIDRQFDRAPLVYFIFESVLAIILGIAA